MTRRALALAIAAGLAGSPAFAGGKGTTSATFLKVPTSGRAVGMAGAFTAITGDVTSLDYNPAGLAGLQRTDITLSYTDFLEGSSFQAAAVAFPFRFRKTGPEPAPGRFDQRRFYPALRYNQFRADDEARNEVGIAQGEISIQDQLLHAGLAFPIRPNIAVGGAIKSIRQELESASSSAIALDAGVVILAPRQWTLGASLLNLGSAQEFEQESDPLPTLIRLGASRPIRSFLVAADVTQTRDAVTRLAAGAEWAANRLFRLRGGVFNESEFGFTAGLGFMFAGPQKAAPLARRSQATGATTTELVFNERRAADLLDRLNFLAAELTERFEAGGRRPADNDLAVLPASGAGERMGPALADLLGQQFYQQASFKVVERGKVENVLKEAGITSTAAMDDAQAARIGRMLNADVIAISQVTRGPSAFSMQTRLIMVSSESAAAASSASFPPDVFSVEKRQPLSAAPTTSPAAQPGRMDIGLDYGFSTQGDFGYSHALSLRILY